MKHRIFYLLVFISILLSACASPQPTAAPESATPEQTTPEASMALQLTSDAFVNGQSIPAKYTCIGKNISPTLTWTEPPAGTQSFALIVDDPDAPGQTWVHWVLFNISASTRSVQEDLPITGKNVDPNAIFVGNNSSGNTSYQGPCPPSGTHRYFFKLYALDTTLSLLPGATKEQVLKAADGHILEQAELMGTFSK
ncbi:MAG: YbhB/YbcL family Raf kinase inhibitor-like protein [Chloroflexota bacterium]